MWTFCCVVSWKGERREEVLSAKCIRVRRWKGGAEAGPKRIMLDMVRAQASRPASRTSLILGAWCDSFIQSVPPRTRPTGGWLLLYRIDSLPKTTRFNA